jgi:hypothetical protein
VRKRKGIFDSCKRLIQLCFPKRAKKKFLLLRHILASPTWLMMKWKAYKRILNNNPSSKVTIAKKKKMMMRMKMRRTRKLEMHKLWKMQSMSALPIFYKPSL